MVGFSNRMQISMLLFTVLVFLTMLMATGCNYSYNDLQDTGTDTSTEQDCDAPICISKITGTVLYDNDQYVQSEECAKFCWSIQGSAQCGLGITNENGMFTFNPWGENDTVGFDFENGDYIHISIFEPNSQPGNETYARYVAAYAPLPSDLDDDNNFDTGTHYLYGLVGEGFEYTLQSGAEIEGDISFTLLPGALGEYKTTIKVLKLDAWEPPFLGDVDVDGLYYLSPYFEGLVGDSDPYFVDIEIDPTNIKGWGEPGDTGVLYMLGDAVGDSGELDCGDDTIEIAEFAICDDDVTIVDGKIKTRISRFGWMGLKKTN